MTSPTPEEFSRRLADESLAVDDSTGWFERLYTAAAAGETSVPWDRGTPHPQLADWVDERAPNGAGRAALVVGAGLGLDAEYIASFGYRTAAFDVSDTAVATARERHPDSSVEYVVADLLDLPPEWDGAYDLVVESLTVQSLPPHHHAAAIAAVSATVASGGTLLVIAAAADDEATQGTRSDGPPWPLTRAEVESFATRSMRVESIDRIPSPTNPGLYRWRAVFDRR